MLFVPFGKSEILAFTVANTLIAAPAMVSEVTSYSTGEGGMESYLSSIPGFGRSPGEGDGNSLQYSWPGEFYGQRSLVGYSPWGLKELDKVLAALYSYSTIQFLWQSCNTGIIHH